MKLARFRQRKTKLRYKNLFTFLGGCKLYWPFSLPCRGKSFLRRAQSSLLVCIILIFENNTLLCQNVS